MGVLTMHPRIDWGSSGASEESLGRPHGGGGTQPGLGGWSGLGVQGRREKAGKKQVRRAQTCSLPGPGTCSPVSPQPFVEMPKLTCRLAARKTKRQPLT